MKPEKRTPVDLAAIWQRHDWRENIFAPGIAIIQALLPDGSTASGAGRGRETALGRCLGETAEWRALNLAVEDLSPGFSPWRDGIAAHPDSAAARKAAVLEACERAAVIRWWQGHLSASPVAAHWMEQHGLTAQLAAARIGAAQKRLTGLWLLQTQGAPCVIVCRSTSLGGQQPILGYGCDVSAPQAAEKALREMLLMEMNLMELLAAGSHALPTRLETLRHRLEVFARRGPAILPATPLVVPDPDAEPPSSMVAEWWSDAKFDCLDITPPGDPFAVWLCRPAFPNPLLPESTDSPFL
jgi:hypothetical protein